MEIDYLRPVPSGVPIRIEGRIVRSEQRKHWVEAGILNSHGTVLARGNGLFIQIRPKKITGQPEGRPDTDQPGPD
jgi:acyl-coenzyme A thioesterase PaaI-like protein